MTQRWLGFWLVLVFVGFGPRIAFAQVTTNPTGVIATAQTVVNTTSPPTSVTVSSTGNPDVDMVVTGTCSGAGAGTFAVSPPTAKLSAAFSITYTPTARGARQCTVSVRNMNATFGTGTQIGTFEVSGSGKAPVVGVSPTSSPYDFMGVRVLETAAPNPSVKSQVFTISNASNDTGQTLNVTGISFSGANAADFAVTATPPSNAIAPLASAPWTVTFNPSDSGLRTATMTIETNDPITPMKTVMVQGTGTLAVIDLSDVTFMPNTPSGTTALSTSTLSNISGTNAGTLTAYSATIDTSTSTWFTFGTGLGCLATNNSASCTFTAGTVAPASIPVRCSPPATASGTETATLTVVSDTDTFGMNTATLTCTAVRPNISIDTTPLAFGEQDVNAASTSKPVTIMNDGTATLSFYFSTDLSMYAASTTTGCGTSTNKCFVAPGGSMLINVTFTPTSTGDKPATLAIMSNDPDSGDNQKNVALSGTGVAPLITVSPASITFTPNVEVGKTSSGVTVTVKNDGTQTLTIDSATMFAGATQFAIASGTQGSQMVGKGASVTWSLTCSPTSHGTKTGTFRIISNSGFGASKVTSDVGLTCTGEQGILTITPSTWNFMGVREADSVSKTFTLQNTGNVPVTNINYVLDAKLLGFAVTSPTFPITINGGQSTTVTVTFAPLNSTYGCAVVNAGDCAITFTGGWGSTPTTTMTKLVVTGQGLKADYDTYPASPNALDLGTVRWDSTVTMKVSVINTGGSALGIKGATITPGTALAGELSVTSCKHNNVTVACPTMAAPFASSGMNDTLEVYVTCNPADRIGQIDGTLTISSDLNTATPNRTVPIKCTSNTATLALTPSNMVLEFGATDLDAIPVAVTRRITLLNTGAATLDVGAGAASGAGLARFAFTSTSARAVAPGTPFDIDVTYTPLSEKPPNAPDVASLTFPLAGHLGGPTSMTIQITGYGADRHVGVSPAPTFADTFKNPGDAAPVMPVTISNTGYAPLDVTAVMLDNDPVWTLVNPDPVVIPAASSHDFMVRFSPLMAGKAPTGHLAVMNNDNEVGKAIVQVDLDGNGLNRNVAMGPRVIPLGFTGIGIPIRLSELAPNDPLVVENGDLVNGFNIATIKVDSIVGADGTFEIVDARGDQPTDVPIDPGGRHSFDITFTPHEVGDFEATATLYLDQDPTPQAQVTLRGRGLYVDARGGGGCSTGGGRTSGWLVLALGALIAGQRRRHRRSHQGRSAAMLGVGIVATLAGTATESAAQSSRNLNISVFEPTPATVGTTFHAQSATVAADGEWAASALLTYANNPLVLDTSQNDDAAVKNRTMLLVGGAYVFGGRYEASARLPVLMQSGDPAGDPLMRFGVDPADGAALGDATLQVKSAIGKRDLIGGTIAYGASLAFTLPTGTGDEFAGNDLPTVRALGLASFTRGRLATTFNLGGVLRESVSFANITQGPGVAWAAGASFRVLDQLWAGGELFGDLVPAGKRTMDGDDVWLNTIEGLAGVHYRISRPMDLGVAVGRGVTTGPGTPAVRGIVTFSYTPGAEELKPIHPRRAPQPPKDTDLDGVRDSLDECVNDIEDMDGFQDDDGCPDPDNDNDGHPDLADGCATEAEDKDRFQDEDGCPDPDNDEDGVLDAKDKCPHVSEDKDGFDDEDGCPDNDNDGDGILDSLDKCPKEAEVINGTTDDDGCPDKGNSLVVLSPDRIELLESIQFSGTRISRSSNNVLGQLGATLRAHPEILRVRLSVHVQPSRNAAADQKLTETRAKAVRDWLVSYGIDALRLQSNGFGGEKPLVPATSRGAQQINDRVELIVLERK